MNQHSLTPKMSVEGLSVSQINTQNYRFFEGRDYEWYYEPMPLDIVVDVGAGVGMFSCLCLDKGAEKTYMIEPNLNLLKTAMINTSPYVINEYDQKVFPVNCSIERPYNEEVPTLTFMDFVDKYKIEKIDYLKVDVHGAEYDIFTADLVTFFKRQIRHASVIFNLDTPENIDKFIKMRNEFLIHFKVKEEVNYNDAMHQKIRFQDQNMHNEIFYSDEHVRAISQKHAFILAYITNY